MLVYVCSHSYSSIHIQYRTMESCKALGINVDNHFREVTKMIALADYLPPLRRLGTRHPPLLPQRHVGQSPMLRPACLFILIV